MFLFCDYNIKSTHSILKIRICISTKQGLNNTMVTFPAGNHHGWLSKLQVTFNNLGCWLLPMFQFCYCAQISKYSKYFYLSLHPTIKQNTSTYCCYLAKLQYHSWISMNTNWFFGKSSNFTDYSNSPHEMNFHANLPHLCLFVCFSSNDQNNALYTLQYPFKNQIGQ